MANARQAPRATRPRPTALPQRSAPTSNGAKPRHAPTANAKRLQIRRKLGKNSAKPPRGRHCLALPRGLEGAASNPDGERAGWHSAVISVRAGHKWPWWRYLPAQSDLRPALRVIAWTEFK